MSLRLSDKEEIDASHMLADVTRSATLNLELSKTNNARYEAARRQLRAVQEAFFAETVEADQVLEAQRRFLDAYLTYVRVTAESRRSRGAQAHHYEGQPGGDQP